MPRLALRETPKIKNTENKQTYTRQASTISRHCVFNSTADENNPLLSFDNQSLPSNEAESSSVRYHYVYFLK